MTVIERVIKFAKTNDIEFDNIVPECEWNGFSVYSPVLNSYENCFIGLPEFILADKHNKIRLAKDDEVYEILESLSDE